MKTSANKLSWGVVLLGINSCLAWSDIGIASFFFTLLISFWVLYLLVPTRRMCLQQKLIDRSSQRLLNIYFIYTICEIVRAVFVADNYWEYKNLSMGGLALMLPLFVYAFSEPDLLKKVLNKWAYWAFPIFFLFVLVIPSGAWHFCLGPIFFLGCFVSLYSRKWRYLLIAMFLIMLVINLGARSQSIKALVALACIFAVVFRKLVSEKLLALAHWAIYIATIVLLYLGISGKYNLFEDLDSNKGKYTTEKVVDGEVVEEDLSSDTRTFIYAEVIGSALKHNYVLFGRSPARGNDSQSFGTFFAEDLKTGKYERYENEVCHPNIFTWTGIIGMLLYCFIYIRSSYLAVYKSHNFYVKLIGVYIAFRWAYGWIEDINHFDISNVGLWMFIAVGFSRAFREMTNAEFVMWTKSIFKKKRRVNKFISPNPQPLNHVQE